MGIDEKIVDVIKERNELKQKCAECERAYSTITKQYELLKEKNGQLKEMVRYRFYLQEIYDKDEIQVSGLGKIREVDKWLQQAVTLANGDSKEESDD